MWPTVRKRIRVAVDAQEVLEAEHAVRVWPRAADEWNGDCVGNTEGSIVVGAPCVPAYGHQLAFGSDLLKDTLTTDCPTWTDLGLSYTNKVVHCEHDRHRWICAQPSEFDAIPRNEVSWIGSLSTGASCRARTR